MGLASYFKAKKPEPPAPAALREKPVATPSPHTSYNMELQPPTFPGGSSRNSISGRSNRSTQSSAFLDDIKHEVMVNYLYQQQCSQLWVSNGTGKVEGVLLRKSKNTYMACPPALGSAPFAAACAALNVQVGIQAHCKTSLTVSVRHDSQLESHQDLPPMVTRCRRRSLVEWSADTNSPNN